MNIFAWILFGLLAGGIAKLLMPGKDLGGCLTTSVIGIIGALLGGFLSRLFGFGPVSGFNIHSLAVAILGSIILLIAFRLFLMRRQPRRGPPRDGA